MRKVRETKRRKAGRKQREAAQSTSFASSDIIEKKGALARVLFLINRNVVEAMDVQCWQSEFYSIKR